MRRSLYLPAVLGAVLLLGCPDDTSKTPTPPPEAPGADALVRPHTPNATGSAATPADPNPKEAPAPDPGPPIGQEETLEPMGEVDISIDDDGDGIDDGPQDGDEDESEPVVQPWAFPPGPGAIDLFPGIRLYKDEERLEVKGRICMKEGPTLELLGCTQQGKTHESLLLFECSPKQLHLALVMIGLRPSPQVDKFGQQVALEKGQKVVLEVTWAEADAPAEDSSAPKAVDGRITRRAEDLIYDQVKKASMPHVGWVFTGSRNVMVPKPPNWDTKHEVYAAEYAGNVAATYHDPDALLDTPLIEGGDDTVYVAYAPRLPERGTRVLLNLRGWRKGDGIETGDNTPTGTPTTPPSDEPPASEDPAPSDDAPQDEAPADDAPQGDGGK